MKLTLSFLGLTLLILLSAVPLAIVFSAENTSAQFERVGPYGGDVRSLLINSHDPQIAFLGTSDGQIFKSTDGGLTWTILFPGIGRQQLALDTLVQHPTEPDHLYAGGWDLRSTGGGLFESRDGGKTWRALKLPQVSAAVRDLSICRSDPSRMIVGTLYGVFVTQDSGATWRSVGTKSPGFRNVESVAIDPRNPNILFVGTWHLAYRSKDFGKTWIRASSGMYFDSDIFSIVVDPRKPGIVYASACSGLYRSTNLAASWERMKVLPDRYGVRARVVQIDPLNSKRIYGGTTEGLFLSENAGQAWKRITSRFITVNAVQVDFRNPRKILIGTDDYGVLRSEDGGRTWQESNSGFAHRQISRIIPDPETRGRFYVGILSDGRKGGFYLFDNHENRWQQLTADIVAKVPVVPVFLPLPDRQGRLAGTVKGLYWQQSPSSPWIKLGGEIANLVIHDLVLDTENSWIFAATSSGIYRSSPARLDFHKPSDPLFSPNVLSIAISHSPPVLYGGGSLGVLRSLDEGATWEIVPGGLPSRAMVECVAVSPSEKNHLFAGTPVGLYESKDGGNSWARANDGRLTIDVPSVMFLDPTGRRVIAADNTFGGVFLSDNAGKTWERIEASEFRSPVRTLSPDPARPFIIYLGTNSDGVYRLRLPEPTSP